MSEIEQYDAIVIGSGFGGLGTALSLSERGFKVGLFEGLKYPGGCAGTFTRKGYRFEAGATLSSGFGEQQLFRKWIDRYQLDVQLEYLETAVHFRSESLNLDIPSNRNQLVEAFCALPNAPQDKIRAFFKHQEQLANTLWALFDEPELLPPWNMMSLLKHLRRFPKYLPLLRDMNRSLFQILHRYHLADFKPLKVYLDALCQITVQCNTDEAEAPFALSTMDYYSRGTAHVVGGLGKLAEELCKAIKMSGGSVQLSNRVKSIQVDPKGGYLIETRKGQAHCHTLIANLLPHTAQQLVKSDINWPQWVQALQDQVTQGWSAAMLYMVAETPRGSSGLAEHWQLVGDEQKPYREGNHIFCSTSSQQETDRAPFGSQTLTISTHIPMGKFLALNDEEQAQYIDQVHETMRQTFQMRCPDWSEQVYFAMTASPRTFERFTSRTHGLVGGIPKKRGLHHYTQIGTRRLAPHFYLVGDSISSGQSTLATATGGHRVAEQIERSFQKHQTKALVNS